MRFVCDVADEQQVVDTFDASVDAAGGRIDSVFANAGRGGTGTNSSTSASTSGMR